MTPLDDQVNVAARHCWNDPYWSSVWPAREQMTSAVTATLLEHLALEPGTRLLDVGSGAGSTTIVAARAVGPSGTVVGADVSEPLVAYASRSAADAGVDNVRFVLADVQTEAIAGAPFTKVMSQFGVMFFEDPVAAFTNVRRHVTPGAAFVFVCWQSPSRNPWFVGHALGDLLPTPAPLAPGAHPTGPFAFREPGHAESLLDQAGWVDAERTLVEAKVVVDRLAVADPGQPAFMGIASDRLPEAADAMDRYFAQFELPDGRLELDIAFAVVTSRASSD